MLLFVQGLNIDARIKPHWKIKMDSGIDVKLVECFRCKKIISIYTACIDKELYFCPHCYEKVSNKSE